MTPTELDALAVVQSTVRSRYRAAHRAIQAWEPAPYVPPASSRPAAAIGSAGGTSTAPGGRRMTGTVLLPAAVPVPATEVTTWP